MGHGSLKTLKGIYVGLPYDLQSKNHPRQQMCFSPTFRTILQKYWWFLQHFSVRQDWYHQWCNAGGDRHTFYSRALSSFRNITLENHFCIWFSSLKVVRQVLPQKEMLLQVSVGSLPVLGLWIGLFACLSWAESPAGDARFSPLAVETGIHMRWWQ